MTETPEPLLYCLTRDRELAATIGSRLDGGLAFFYNDAARLHQAVILRAPQHVLVDIAAIRPEYGDAGLGPVVAFVRERLPEAQISVRPRTEGDRLVAAEAGPDVTLLPPEIDACAAAVAQRMGPRREGGQ